MEHVKCLPFQQRVYSLGKVGNDMCHLVLLMPFLALPVFWLLPLSVAASIYSVVLGVSAWLYIYVFKALSRPVVCGREEILHARGEIIDVHDHQLHVRVHSEVWGGESSDTLSPGDKVEVVDMEDLKLKVKKVQQ